MTEGGDFTQTIWLLTQGSYSDYSVVAAFASKEVIDHVVAVDIDGEWNDPEECQIIHDSGTPLDVLRLWLYRGNYGGANDNQLRIIEKHELQWPWQEWGKMPPVEGQHLTIEKYHQRVESRRGFNYSRPADDPSWVNGYPIAQAAGTDHTGVRKAFSEHRAQALATLTQAEISWRMEESA